MAEEKKVTETKTETKNDFFGNPKEEKSTTTEKKSDDSAFGDREKTTTTVERKEEYEMVKSLGVHLVQGFFVHRPSTSGVSYRPPIHPAPALAEGAK